jgi:hypothetical protein
MARNRAHCLAADLKKQDLYRDNFVAAADSSAKASASYFQLVRSNNDATIKNLRREKREIESALWDARRVRKNKPEKVSRLSIEAQRAIAKAELDAVVAIEREEEKDALLKAAMAKLDLTETTLNSALKDAHECTDWVDLLGKKGERYSLVMVEIGLQMMSSMLSAPQAVFCLTMFMQTTYPGLVAGEDYRLPTESTFKRWGELLYPLVRDLNRSVVDDAFIIYLHHDGSPRNHLKYTGYTSKCGFKTEEGDDEYYPVPLAMELLADGCDATAAKKGVGLLGDDNLEKVCMIMADNAALGVAKAMYKEKQILVTAKIESGVDIPEDTREIMETDFVGRCAEHVTDLGSNEHVKHEKQEQIRQTIMNNAATYIQHFFCVRTLYSKILSPLDPGRPRESLSDIEDASEGRLPVWKSIFGKVLFECTGRSRFEIPMELKKVPKMGQKEPLLVWKLVEPVVDVWDGLKTFSSLVSDKGKHQVLPPFLPFHFKTTAFLSPLLPSPLCFLPPK